MACAAKGESQSAAGLSLDWDFPWRKKIRGKEGSSETEARKKREDGVCEMPPSSDKQQTSKRNLNGNVREMTPDDKEQIKSELPTVKTASTVAQQVHVWLKSLPLTDF